MKRSLSKVISVAFTAIVAALATLHASAQVQATNQVQNASNPAYVPGELLLKFKPTVTDDQIQEVFNRASLNLIRHIRTDAMRQQGQMGLTRVSTTLNVLQAVQMLKGHPALEYAQPNWLYHHMANIPPDDTLYGSLWGMDYDASTDAFGTGAVQAWDAGYTGSNNVYVGVIDEGIQFTHPDLAANIWNNLSEVNGTTGVDDDGDGYVDDLHGWNAVNNNGTIFDPAGDDHGTHVSGTIGGVGANGAGVAGVNWHVTIISGKFLNASGSGSTVDAVEAIDYMTNLKIKGTNIVALNNSWGGGPFDQSLLDAITRAANQNILFVAAAGNGNSMGVAVNTDNQPNYPSCYDTSSNGASYDSVITVTAIDKSGNKASWANYGANTVDIGAPGVAITSTVPNNSYASYDGTSMATPHVTGAIALYAATHPGAKAADIKKALLDSAKLSANQTASLSGKTSTGGRLNVWDFLNTPTALDASTTAKPTDPVAGSATAKAVSSSRIDVSWPDFAANATAYRVQRLTNNVAVGSDVIVDGPLSADGTTLTYSDTAVFGSTTYSYRITAYNAAGDSAALTTAAVTTPTPPPPPYVQFVSKDTNTKGNWIGKYGSQGYTVIDYATNTPAYTVTPATQSDWMWASSTTDTRGLQKPDNTSDRYIACWYSAGSFTVDLNFTDTDTHRVVFYVVDWETTTRAMTLDMINPADNSVIAGQSQNVTSYNGGQYLLWDVQGHVIVRFTCTGGKNATVSGVFVDAPPAAPSAPTALTAIAASSTQVNLTWNESSTVSSFTIQRSTGNGAFTQIGTATASARSYSDTSAAPGTTYSYQVIAVNNSLNSQPSNAATHTDAAVRRGELKK